MQPERIIDNRGNGLLVKDLKPGMVYLCRVSNRRVLAYTEEEENGFGRKPETFLAFRAWNPVTGQVEQIGVVDGQLMHMIYPKVPPAPRDPNTPASTVPLRSEGDEDRARRSGGGLDQPTSGS